MPAVDRHKIIRTSTIPLSLKMFCKELLCEIKDRYDVLAVSSDGPQLRELQQAGIPTEAVEMRREIAPIADLRSLVSLIRLCRRHKPYIIHSITPKAGLLTMLAARIAGVPVRIHSFTGLLFPTAHGFKRLILKTTDRITCACATHILPEGKGVKNDLIDARITHKPLRVLGNGNLRGIDLDYYTLRQDVVDAASRLRSESGIAAGEFVFLFVGRIVRDKGISELAQAFARIVRSHSHAHLVLVGEEEPETDPLDTETRHLLSHTPHVHRSPEWTDDVRPYYAMSDALVLPSYREGFPNVVLEAGAMGVASIVTDINGSNEIITHGYNGHIIQPHDTENLYNTMEYYINHHQTIKSLSANCRQLIAAKFDARYVRGCLKELYEQLSNLQKIT